MSCELLPHHSVVGRRMRERREALGFSQERVGVAIGIDEGSARARISRYELGVHEPAVDTARRIAIALNVSLAYLYCDDDQLAQMLLAFEMLEPDLRAAITEEVTSLVRARCR